MKRLLTIAFLIICLPAYADITVSGESESKSYQEGAIDTEFRGPMMMGESSDQAYPVKVDTSGNLQVDVLTMPSVSTDNSDVVDALNILGATVDSVKLSVQTIDDAISGNEMQVDVLTMPSISVDNTDVVNALNTLGATLDTVVSNQLADGHNVTVDNASIAVTGTFWQATQPISGTVTANAGANLNTSGLASEATSNAIGATLDSVKTSLGNMDNSVDGNYLNVNVNLAGTDAQAGEGIISASTQRVTIATDDDGVTHLSTIAGDTTDIETAIELLDNSVDGNYLNTNINVAGTDVAANAGVNNAQTQRVTVATDDEINDDIDAIRVSGQLLDDAISGSEMQVDVVASLPAGTNAIGKLAANSGVDIGDVDVTSIVSGTGATNLGKAEDGGHSSGDVGVMVLAIRDDDPPALTSATAGDYEPLHTDSLGRLWVQATPNELDLATASTTHVKKYYTNAGAVTDGIVWSPAAGKRWYVTDIIITVSAAATVTLEDDLAAGDSAVFKAELAANSGISHSFTTPWFSGEDAADLIITTSAGNVYVTVVGYEI